LVSQINSILVSRGYNASKEGNDGRNNKRNERITEEIDTRYKRDVLAKQTEIMNLQAEMRELRESVAARDLRIAALENKVLKMDEMQRRIQDMELFTLKKM